mmetsp:Transcript_33065/g.69099  ORF Transcript_33065/g.69099 Transcript_33065/m.69099 type:complete len:299 (+) Transcript_33065:115-1011(+)
MAATWHPQVRGIRPGSQVALCPPGVAEAARRRLTPRRLWGRRALTAAPPRHGQRPTVHRPMRRGLLPRASPPPHRGLRHGCHCDRSRQCLRRRQCRRRWGRTSAVVAAASPRLPSAAAATSGCHCESVVQVAAPPAAPGSRHYRPAASMVPRLAVERGGGPRRDLGAHGSGIATAPSWTPACPWRAVVLAASAPPLRRTPRVAEAPHGVAAAQLIPGPPRRVSAEAPAAPRAAPPRTPPPGHPPGRHQPVWARLRRTLRPAARDRGPRRSSRHHRRQRRRGHWRGLISAGKAKRTQRL